MAGLVGHDVPQKWEVEDYAAAEIEARELWEHGEEQAKQNAVVFEA